MNLNNISDDMNHIKNACTLLHIHFEDLHKITFKTLKKQYHKMALKWHPDKNGNTIEATQYFQKINESYQLLSVIITTENGYTYDESFVRSSSYEHEKNEYISLLGTFVSNIIKGNYTDIISNIIQTIVSDCKNISWKLFDGLDKETTMEVYQFLCKYKQILYLNDDIIQQIKEIMIRKFQNDKVYILNPTIDDLFENNIYKLVVDGNLYLVPLWHSELYFDANGHDIIVFCIPDLPNNIFIDEDNNLLVDLEIGHKILSELLDKTYITVPVGLRNFEIKADALHVKKTQHYILWNEGISQIMEKDTYNTSKKSNIIFNIQITLSSIT